MTPRRLLKAADEEIDRAERLLEIAHVAKRLSVCAETARKLIKSGKLPGMKLESGLWRVRQGDLDAYIASKRFTAITNGQQPGH